VGGKEGGDKGCYRWLGPPFYIAYSKSNCTEAGDPGVRERVALGGGKIDRGLDESPGKGRVDPWGKRGMRRLYSSGKEKSREGGKDGSGAGGRGIPVVSRMSEIQTNGVRRLGRRSQWMGHR